MCACPSDTVNVTFACSPSPIIPELAYKMGNTDQKRKYGKYNVTANYNDKIMANVMV
jgi:hypothetical protein